MEHIYKTRGVCSKEITFELGEDNTIKSCSFKGGCPGNLLGISQLIIGQKAEEIIPRVKGTKCGFKSTSCPDQLALALEEAIAAK